MKLIPTDLQKAIIDIAKTEQRIKIEAGAGCSKTTSLVMVADELCVPSLYLTFNKKMADEAKEKFPGWVEVRTTHSLAFGVFGADLQHKLNRPQGAYRNVCGTGGEIAKYFKIPVLTLSSGKYLTAAGVGLAVKETLNKFEFSEDTKIGIEHVSFNPATRLKRDLSFNKVDYCNLVIQYAKKLWELRINPKSNVLATHDTYLKLYQMSNPDFSHYEVIYLDESQDLNPCIIDIINKQKDSKIIAVGDTSQAIYGWRGSVNAMKQFDFKEGVLDKSFRFGQAIADVANDILGSEKVKGHEYINSKVLLSTEYEGEKGHTLLFRTNIALIVEAVELVSKGVLVNLEFDLKDFIRLLDSALALKQGNKSKVKHEELLSYPDWETLMDENKTVGGEISRVVWLIETGKVYSVLGLLSSHVNTKNPEVILTTVHKSKGREFDVVVLADDFPSCYNTKGEWVGLDEAETNLLYVAATRAKSVLVLNTTVEDIIEKAGSNSKSNVCSGSCVRAEDYSYGSMLNLQIKQMAFLGVNTTEQELMEATSYTLQSDNAIAAQDQLDEYDNLYYDEEPISHNLDGTLRLMPVI